MVHLTHIRRMKWKTALLWTSHEFIIISFRCYVAAHWIVAQAYSNTHSFQLISLFAVIARRTTYSAFQWQTPIVLITIIIIVIIHNSAIQKSCRTNELLFFKFLCLHYFRNSNNNIECSDSSVCRNKKNAGQLQTIRLKRQPAVSWMSNELASLSFGGK